ncbi:MAG: hypothetical protein C4291_13855 [Candidatus Dadabacteria bacterium]|mgnify:CR=1 FL=1
MKIVELVWEEWHVEHIVSRYSVRPSEIEEACFEDESIRVLRGQEGLYYVLGKTLRDRYLHIVIKPTGKGKAKVITARDMNGSEKRLYKGVK